MLTARSISEKSHNCNSQIPICGWVASPVSRAIGEGAKMKMLRFIPGALAICALLLSCDVVSAQSATQRLSHTRFFHCKIVEVGGVSSEQDAQALWQLLDTIG